MILGVKEHGVGLTIFRNFDNVSKGCNVTIFCILMMLEKFNIRHGYYPEKLYLQVDGGSENANQYVLAMLELLVVKRCCRDVYYSRLPAGHTHEDIRVTILPPTSISRESTFVLLAYSRERNPANFLSSSKTLSGINAV